MHNDELWQVYAQNGAPIVGRGEVDDAFVVDKDLIMGNAHVWLWRKNTSGKEILLQKRSMDRKRSPGMYHVSAAGHINTGESSVDAAVREAKEEMGISLDISQLYFVQTARSGQFWQSLNSVFIYQTHDDSVFRFDDGEVESIKWVDLDNFRTMIKAPAGHSLIDQGSVYFNMVIDAIERQ